jgi:2,5-diamino-6-(ribosylamino)-4(3H)-pyrimidinone 5'-phosphate reductase
MLPYVVIHNEMSLDARMDGLDVDMGRFYALAGTWHEDCALVGSETLLAGMPELGEPTATLAPEPGDGLHSGGSGASPEAPLVAVVDSGGRLPGLGLLRNQPYWRDVVALCAERTPAAHLELLRASGISAIIAGEERVDLRRALESRADEHDVKTVRVDAGGALVGTLLRQRLVSEVSVIVEPRLVGGESHRWLVRAPDAGPADVVTLALRQLERLDDDALWLRYDVNVR